MPAPDAILQLVQRYDDQIKSYQSARYNETGTRRELIDPFFHALGWDVDNSQPLPVVRDFFPMVGLTVEEVIIVEGWNR